MSEGHLLAAARYVELNPVRARLAKEAWLYKWSSAAAHVNGVDDELVHVEPLLAMAGEWRGFIGQDVTDEGISIFRSHERTGRPLGGESFLKGIEKSVGRVLRRRKPGPKRRKQIIRYTVPGTTESHARRIGDGIRKAFSDSIPTFFTHSVAIGAATN